MTPTCCPCTAVPTALSVRRKAAINSCWMERAIGAALLKSGLVYQFYSARARVCVCVRARACVRACVRACLRVCVHACWCVRAYVCVCVCVREREREREISKVSDRNERITCKNKETTKTTLLYPVSESGMKSKALQMGTNRPM